MNDRHRLDHLHLLLDRLARLPESADRDWMLTEVRARAVDVETGVRPRPMRPFDPDAAVPPPEPVRSKAATVTRTPPRETRSAPVETRRSAEIRQVRAAPEEAVPPTIDVGRLSLAEPGASVDLLEAGGLLSLDDLSAEASAADGDAPPAGWVRGLRG
jgi:hypothetical protein